MKDDHTNLRRMYQARELPKVEARELRRGWTLVDPNGNERAITQVRIVSPRMVMVSAVTANGTPSGDTYRPGEQVVCIPAPEEFTPEVY